MQKIQESIIINENFSTKYKLKKESLLYRFNPVSNLNVFF